MTNATFVMNTENVVARRTTQRLDQVGDRHPPRTTSGVTRHYRSKRPGPLKILLPREVETLLLHNMDIIHAVVEGYRLSLLVHAL